MHFCAFVGSNYSNLIVMHGMGNVKLIRSIYMMRNICFASKIIKKYNVVKRQKTLLYPCGLK